jgi:hypothetical protein
MKQKRRVLSELPDPPLKIDGRGLALKIGPIPSY